MDKNNIAVAVFDRLAKLYQDKFMDVSLYNESFKFFCNNIKQNAEILELACGPGNITKHLLSLRPDLKITGTDLSPNMIALAAKNNPPATFKIMDCREIEKSGKTYDAVICGFCLPYLSKEETTKLISDAAEAIRTAGLIYISTMEDDYSNSGFRKGSGGDEIFMHFYQENDLVSVLEENKFAVTYLDRKNYRGDDGRETTDLIIIAQKNNLK
jgi:2-polyprenyl-3-methyl-5-hydroxy-6-metoxy-1,4-benzoquinol methylase